MTMIDSFTPYGGSIPGVQEGFLPVRPNLIFQEMAWDKLMGFVLACPIEVNGFGYVRQYGYDLWVDDTFILPQIASAGHAETDSEAVGAHMSAMLANDQDPSSMKLQWHSHVNMPAYFSGTDLDTIEACSAKWRVSLVINKAGEYSARLDIYEPFRITTPMQVYVPRTIPADIAAQCQEGIKQNVRTLGGLTGRRRKRVASELPGSYLNPGTDSQYS